MIPPVYFYNLTYFIIITNILKGVELMDIVALMKRDDRIREYIEYLDRCNRTLKVGRAELHKKANSRNVATYYGLDINDINILEKQFAEEESK